MNIIFDQGTHEIEVAAAVSAIKPGEYRELTW